MIIKHPYLTDWKITKSLTMGKTNIFVTNVTIEHLYISTLELTRNHMKIIDLHVVNVTIKLDKVQTVRNTWKWCMVRWILWLYCDHRIFDVSTQTIPTWRFDFSLQSLWFQSKNLTSHKRWEHTESVYINVIINRIREIFLKT